MLAIPIDMLNAHLPFMKDNPITMIAIFPFLVINPKTLPTEEYTVTVNTKHAPELLDDVPLERLRF